MRALEILLERRWILKSREKELYYQIKDELGTVKKFLMEKLGYQVIVNPYLVKVEKMPATPENWMGIQEFTRKIEYVFFCMILMFLEEKEAEEQFVLSELTEYIQGQYREEQIDWTVYQYRRHLIKVIKYCVNCGILNLNDGSEENFARDDTSEVLYENTGVSRYFMKNFTQDIMGYTTPEDQAEKESLSDSDTVKLKQREVEIKSQLEGLKKNITGKQRQEEEKKEKYHETDFHIEGLLVPLCSFLPDRNPIPAKIYCIFPDNPFLLPASFFQDGPLSYNPLIILNEPEKNTALLSALSALSS